MISNVTLMIGSGAEAVERNGIDVDSIVPAHQDRFSV